MSILTISVPFDLICCLQQAANVRSVNDLDDALRSISTEDFHYIVEDVRQCPRGYQDLNLLLGSTTPGTRIVAIASLPSHDETEYWQSLGVAFLYAGDQVDLAFRLLDDYSRNFSQKTLN